MAVIQFDQGSFHRLKSLDWPENIIPIFQPPHSPEMNPIERVWEWLKSQLQWGNCVSLDQLRHKLSELLAAITPLANHFSYFLRFYLGGFI